MKDFKFLKANYLNISRFRLYIPDFIFYEEEIAKIFEKTHSQRKSSDSPGAI